MNNILELPHRPAPGLCMLNGLRDLIHWRSGRNWSTEFLYGLSGGSGLTLLAIAAAGLVAVVFIARKLRTAA